MEDRSAAGAAPRAEMEARSDARTSRSGADGGTGPGVPEDVAEGGSEVGSEVGSDDAGQATGRRAAGDVPVDPQRQPQVEVEVGTVEGGPGGEEGTPQDAGAPPVAAPAPGGRGPLGRWRRLPRSVKGTLTVVVLFFVLEYVILPEVASARKSVKLLGQVDILWLCLAVALEACALAAYAELTHTVLSPGAPSRFRLLRINMSSLAVSHVLPGGTAPGAAVAYRLLGESGVRGTTAAFGLATQGVGSAVVLNIIFWFFLLISIPLRGYNPLYGFAAIAGVILLAVFGGIVLMLTRGKGQGADRLYRIAARVPFVNPERLSVLVQRIADRLTLLLRNRQLVTRAMIWAAANWLLDAASLWVFILAFGHLMSPIDLLVAYGLANILAVIPLTPSGLGVVEGVLIPTLAGFGVPKDIAVLGVLTWRLVNFWLPIPMGGAAYLSLRLGPFARRVKSSQQDGHPANGHATG